MLTLGNPKILKGEAQGYYSAVLHLAPAWASGIANTCPMSTEGCRATCLNTAGRGGIVAKGKRTNAIQQARKRKTRALFTNRAAFMAALEHAIRLHVARAKRLGMRPAIRLNGTSDLPFLAAAIVPKFPDVQFYDYTKIPRPWERVADNYHVTFSRSESNGMAVRDAMAHGINVAVVFSTKRGQALPDTWEGYPVLDGDEHDLRFLDKPGHIVGLRAKGKARKDASGFVVGV